MRKPTTTASRPGSATDRLTQRAQAATIGADRDAAKAQFEVDDKLFKEGLQSEPAARDFERALQLAREALSDRAGARAGGRGQLQGAAPGAAGAASISCARSTTCASSRSISCACAPAWPACSNRSRSASASRSRPGTNLARVADPTRLKAELRIAETQAKDLTIGQRAQVDTRNGIIEGKVIRIDPSAQQGTVTVDVELDRRAAARRAART